LVKQDPNFVPPDPVFEKGSKMEEEEEIKNEVFSRIGGDFVATGKNGGFLDQVTTSSHLVIIHIYSNACIVPAAIRTSFDPFLFGANCYEYVILFDTGQR
jgi:hypothetical protein